MEFYFSSSVIYNINLPKALITYSLEGCTTYIYKPHKPCVSLQIFLIFHIHYAARTFWHEQAMPKKKRIFFTLHSREGRWNRRKKKKIEWWEENSQMQTKEVRIYESTEIKKFQMERDFILLLRKFFFFLFPLSLISFSNLFHIRLSFSPEKFYYFFILVLCIVEVIFAYWAV